MAKTELTGQSLLAEMLTRYGSITEASKKLGITTNVLYELKRRAIKGKATLKINYVQQLTRLAEAMGYKVEVETKIYSVTD